MIDLLKIFIIEDYWYDKQIDFHSQGRLQDIQRNQQTTFLQSPHSADTLTMRTESPMTGTSYTGEGIQE
jgi:hypothetical protein